MSLYESGDSTGEVSFSVLEEDVTNSFALEKLFVIEEVNATKLNFRSKYRVRTKPKRYFTDPSIATALLDISPQNLIRDLKIYTEYLGGDLSFYHDEKDFEVDVILRLPNDK